jgi:MFS family permease
MSARLGDVMESAIKEPTGAELRLVVAASAAGTAFEWYDFLVFGLLADIFAKRFFAGLNPSAGLIFALLAFAAGFAVRPFGALIFGHFGDRLGRKGAFLVTISLMGLATFAIGFLPTYDQVGIVAPVLLISIRMLQGLAIGGEYGGAAIYVAEHARPGRRGWLTGWIQTSAAFGLAGAIGIVLLTRTSIGEEAFTAWGWRVPFLLSIGLFGISIFMRLRLHESPAFLRVQQEGALSRAPLLEAFFNWRHLKLVLVALFSILMAQGTVWYTASFYAPVFVQNVLKVSAVTVNEIMLMAVGVSAVLYVFFGWLSDIVGRKPVMLLGIAGASLTFFPAFHLLTEYANPALAQASRTSPVIVVADPATCTIQFDPIGKAEFTSSCDIAKSALAQAGVSYQAEAGPPAKLAIVRIGNAELEGVDARVSDPSARKAIKNDFQKRLRAALGAAGYPEKADPARIDKPRLLGVFLWFVLCATALYGPMAAALVELFPTRIRYSALSLPYHVGIGWFGGFLPAIAFAIVTATGDIYAGLWYPVVTAGLAAVIGLFTLPETKGRDINR